MSDLNVTIGADISAYQQGMQQAGAVSSSTTDRMKADLQTYQALAEKTFDPALLGTYNNQIKNLQNSISMLGKQAEVTADDTRNIAKDGISGINALGGATQSASMKFMQMRSGISAARDGVMAFTLGGQAAERSLMAMGHHINSLVNETGSFGGAFKALGASLWGPGGIILALTVAFELWQHFSKGAKDAAESTKEYADTLNAVDSARLKGAESGAQEITRLKILYDATQNHALSLKSRNQAYDELASKYPKFFSNADREKTLLGENTLAYQALAGAIMSAAYAKAYEAKIGENANRDIENQQKILTLRKQQAEEEKVISFYKKANSSTYIGEGGGASQGAAQLQARAEGEVADIKKKINDLLTDSGLLTKQNADLSKRALDAEVAAGFKTTQEIEKKDKALKKQKDGFAAIEAEISKLKVKLEDAVISGDKLSVKNLTSSIIEATTKLDALKEKYILAFYPHMNDTLPSGNKTTQNSIDAIQQPLQNNPTGNDVAAAIKAHKAEKDAIWQSYLVTKQYNEENKLENQTLKELTNTIGRGLTHAFESALNGTQSFVSAMGQFLLQLIEKLIAAAAAAAILAILLSATGFGAIGSFGSIFGSLSGLSGLVTGQSSGGGGSPGHYAEGGIFNKATVGMFGEAGKEAIVTPEHLADFAGLQSQQQAPQQLSMKLQGSDMLLFLNRANKTKSRTS